VEKGSYPDSYKRFRKDVKCRRGWCSVRNPENPYAPKTLRKRNAVKNAVEKKGIRCRFLIMRFVAVFYFVLICSARSQLWVTDYKYDTGSFDSAKWNMEGYWGDMGYLSSFYNNNNSTFSIVVHAPSFANPAWRWKEQLPLNTNWTAITRLKSDFIVDDSKRWALAALFANAAGQSIAPMLSLNGSQTSINEQNIPRDQYFWMGLTYNFTERKIFSVFSLQSDISFPENNTFNISSNSISTIGYEASTASIYNNTYFNGGELTYSDFKIAAFSVPEPSSLSLLLAGGAVFAAARRRKLD